MLPQTPVKVQKANVNQLTAMLTPVNVVRRLTAKSEPIPESDENRNDLKKCPLLIIFTKQMRHIIPNTAVRIFAEDGITRLSFLSRKFLLLTLHRILLLFSSGSCVWI